MHAHTARHPDRTGGFSLVELAIASSLIGVLVYIVMSLSTTGTQAQQYANRLTRVTELGQDISDDVRAELLSSVRLFEEDVIGRGYLGLLDFRGARAGIAYRLPTLDEQAIFEPDTATRQRTGNALLFARFAWTTVHTPTGSPRPYRVDVYRMVHYYPSPEGGGPRLGRSDGLNLVKWVGEPMADGEQIDEISDPTARASVLDHMLRQTPDDNGDVHPRVEVVWQRGGDPAIAGTLRQVTTGGGMSTAPTAPRSSPWRIMREPSLSSNRVLHPERHSVATSFAPAKMAVGRFGQLSTTGVGFPHGLELQMIGPAAARQILVRLVLVTTNNAGHKAHVAVQTIADARDL